MKISKPVRKHQRGGVLLEVIMALALIVGASTVITDGFQSAMYALERMRNGIHGVNLAVTVFSEIQMGLIAAESCEDTEFEEPFSAWTYSLEIEEVEDLAMSISEDSDSMEDTRRLMNVDVTIKNPEGQVVQRMMQTLYLDPTETSSEEGGSEIESSTYYGS